MVSAYLLGTLTWVMSLSLVVGSPPALDFELRPRGPPSRRNSDPRPITRRALPSPRVSGVYERALVTTQNTTSLDSTWEDAVLFSYGVPFEGDTDHGDLEAEITVAITCKTCYIKGNVLVQTTRDDSFDFQRYKDGIIEEVKNFTSNAIDYVGDYIGNVTNKLSDGIDADDFDPPPTMPFDFNLDIPDIPEYRLLLQFDGLELYMDLSTVLSVEATYTLNVYSSNTPIGISLGDKGRLGAVLTVDLVLSAEAEIEINSGFHIKLEDGVAIDIPLFSNNVSSITFPGGQFEFLPVTVMTPGVALKAALRVGVHVGTEIQSSSVADYEASGGIDVAVFATVAEFTTNVILGGLDDENDCNLRVTESYQLALGAEAGASIAVGPHTWGPTPETEIPLWYTTLADVCANQGQPSTTATATTPGLRARADDNLTTTTTTTEVVYTGVSCQSPGLVNCPASLQTTTRFTTTKTLTTMVSSGSEATFASTTRNTVVSPIAFGSNAYSLRATTGLPVSYVPEVSGAGGNSQGGSAGDDHDDDGNNHNDHKDVIIGVTVGVGVPVLAAIIGGCFYLYRRRRYSAVPKYDTPVTGHKMERPPPGTDMTLKKAVTNVTVVEEH